MLKFCSRLPNNLNSEKGGGMLTQNEPYLSWVLAFIPADEALQTENVKIILIQIRIPLFYEGLIPSEPFSPKPQFLM